MRKGRILSLAVAAALFSMLLAQPVPAGAAGVGTPGSDHVIGTPGPDKFHLLDGDDFADGRGDNDHLLGGDGNDVLIGGRGRDFVSGDGGNDFIRVADGEKDIVECGPGFDQVIADMAKDVVAGDCERVVQPRDGRLKIVQLGDSIAAGEGINYGFTWDATKMAWNKPAVPNPTWEGKYQQCHRSAKAYSSVVAANLNADVTSFACTGASYAAGVTGTQPFQEGNVPAQLQQLAASNIKPDLILITLGANDVRFADIVQACIFSNLISPSNPECTASNPGRTLNNAFWGRIDGVAQNWKNLVDTLRQTFGGPGTPPIIFTTYYNPLVVGTASSNCVDNLLATSQNAYLGTLIDTLKTRLKNAVGDQKGVSVADVSGVVAGHEWCTTDPWAYGPGTIASSGDLNNKAPVHPTPEGQQRIAKVVQNVATAMLSS